MQCSILFPWLYHPGRCNLLQAEPRAMTTLSFWESSTRNCAASLPLEVRLAEARLCSKLVVRAIWCCTPGPQASRYPRASSQPSSSSTSNPKSGSSCLAWKIATSIRLKSAASRSQVVRAARGDQGKACKSVGQRTNANPAMGLRWHTYLFRPPTAVESPSPSGVHRGRLLVVRCPPLRCAAFRGLPATLGASRPELRFFRRSRYVRRRAGLSARLKSQHSMSPRTNCVHGIQIYLWVLCVAIHTTRHTCMSVFQGSNWAKTDCHTK